MYLCNHNCARYSGKVAKHRRVNASTLCPELNDPEEIPIDSVIRNLLLDICIAKVPVETLLRKRRQFVELLLHRYHLLNVIL